MAARALPNWPRVLRASAAAAYAGYASAREFLRDVGEGIMPAPFTLNGVDAWNVDDINTAIDTIKAGARRVSRWQDKAPARA